MRKLKFTIFVVIFSLSFLAQLGWLIPLTNSSWGVIFGFPTDASASPHPDTNIPTVELTSLYLEGAGNSFISPLNRLMENGSFQVSQVVWPLVLLQFATAFFLALVGCQVLSRRIAKPLKGISQQMYYLKCGELDRVVDVDGGGELKSFTDSFNKMLRSITSREKVVGHYAFHDSLTSMPNRNRFLEDVDKRLRDGLQSVTVTKITLKNFADINANLGREIGDLIIMEVARWLQMVTEPGNLFHFGGSSFVLLDTTLESEDTDKHIKSLIQYMSKEYRFQSISLYVEPQLGVAIYPLHGKTAEHLLQRASAALNYAVYNNLSGVIYSEDILDQNIERLKLINELKSAIDLGQLSLHFQPKLHLATQQIHSVEVLVRWLHPERGYIPPSLFVSFAEQSGLINTLTYWVTEEAINQYKSWRARGIDLNLAINFSAKNLKEDEFVDNVVAMVAEHELEPGALIMEITESDLMEDPARSFNVLNLFKSVGFHFSIDDYGTGYSSLAQLKKLPVDELKIDRSFIHQLRERHDDQVIVQSTVDLAHKLGLTVVAEGVEDEETLSWLIDSGCDTAQGYFISHPLPADELTLWLENCRYYSAEKSQAMDRA